MSECVGFNVPLDTISGTIFTARWPNQQCQSTGGNQLVVEMGLELHQNHSTML